MLTGPEWSGSIGATLERATGEQVYGNTVVR